jgi:protein-S-isoprenylcysteine O-methyltransferase Ste14
VKPRRCGPGSIWLPAPSSSGGAPAAAMPRRIQVEEAELTRVLGDPYHAYRNRTKRLVPGLW